MKAERRHELKINTLDDAIAKMHKRWRQYATWTVTSVVAVVLVGVLIHNRMVAAQVRANHAADDMAVVRSLINEIRMFSAQDRDLSLTGDVYHEINARLDSVLSTAGDSNPKLAAEALVSRGDAAWHMRAALTATTQPTGTQPQPADLERTAQTAYKQVVSQYPKQHFSVQSARFGLAGIAENQHDWDEARREYQAIIDDPDAGDVLSGEARTLLASVDSLQRPPMLGQMLTPATAPAMPTTQK